MNPLRIVVLPGDGIGVDVTREALRVLDAAQRRFGFRLDCEPREAGADCYRRTGTDLPGDTLTACREADAVFLGAMGDPSVRKPDGTELTPQVTLRVELDLYAGVRPCRLYPAARTPLAGDKAIDFVILREQTEGLFASQEGGVLLKDAVATDTLVITRPGTERIAAFAFDLARTRKRTSGAARVTCVDKANIFTSFAFFRRVFLEVARKNPEIPHECTYIDAQALFLVQRPERYDVVVTENMFGDILSDLAAGLIGGMGMAPSGDVGERHAVFQPAHGTAPDIAGKGVANPIAAILSAGMLLDWLGRRRGLDVLTSAGDAIEQAVARTLREGRTLPVDQGGRATTSEVGATIADAVSRGNV